MLEHRGYFQDNLSKICRRCLVTSKTPGISSPYPSSRLIFPRTYQKHWWLKRRAESSVRWKCAAEAGPPALILSWKWPSFLCFTFLASSHMGKWEKKSSIGCMESYFRGRYGKENPSGDFPFCAARSFHPTCLDCLRKTASSLSCFLSTVHGKFSRKVNLFSSSHTLKCHQIFSFTQVFAGWWLKVKCESGGRVISVEVRWGLSCHHPRRYADVVIFLYT